MKSQEIRSVATRCAATAARYGNIPPFPSVLAQLEYLAGVAEGSADKSRLSEIVMGVQAAREIESLDEELAEMIYTVDAWAQKLRNGR